MIAHRDRSTDVDRLLAILTGRPPLPWQSRLTRSLVSGVVPSALDLPTGLGKTDAIPCFLAAHAIRSQSLTNGSPVDERLPTRLVWVVDRRAVVDQAATFAAACVGRLAASVDPLAVGARDALLARCAFSSDPVSVSSWRGGAELDRTTVLDPLQVSVMTATVDMAGSRILASGYGTGRWSRTHDAGIWGHDVLVVVDESHLSPVLVSTLRQVSAMQSEDGSPRPLRVMAMSATGAPGASPLTLDADDLAHPFVTARLNGPKTLVTRRVPGPSGKSTHRVALAEAMVEEAISLRGPRVVVYADRPDVARQVSEALRKRKASVVTVTGRQRQHERRSLRDDPVMAAFASPAHDPDAPRSYLVATSAAEVGLDVYPDDAVMDVVDPVRLVQRLGRVNRAGATESRVVLIVPDGPCEAARDALLSALSTLPTSGAGLDVSVRAVREHLADVCRLTTTGPRIDAAAVGALMAVSARDVPGIRPSVGHWLREPEDAAPELTVAWRAEVLHLAGQPVAVLDAWADACPILPHEALTLPPWEAWPVLRRMGPSRDHVLCLGRDGAWTHGMPDKEGQDGIDVVLLSPEVGGLDAEGFLAAKAPRDGLDVGLTARTLVVGGKTTALAGNAGSGWRTLTLPLHRDDPDDAPRAIRVRTPPPGRVSLPSAASDTSLAGHNAAVSAMAARIARLAGLDGDSVAEFARAGLHHDDGKHRRTWQAFVGGSMAAPLAKSRPGHRPALVADGYRHEVGSLHAMGIADRPQGDLAAHLVAAHHGRLSGAADPSVVGDRDRTPLENLDLIVRASRNRDRLVRRHGHWGLAWLEALFRSADRAVSAGIERAEADATSLEDAA